MTQRLVSINKITLSKAECKDVFELLTSKPCVAELSDEENCYGGITTSVVSPVSLH